jgi:hypothetical protein
MISGSSKKTLAERLGIKEGSKILVESAPENYITVLGKLPKDALVLQGIEGNADIIHLFATGRAGLEDRFPVLK